ncbi:hypothetical protein [Sphingobium chungbukense]|uniref:Uncharacterized protein n=1 Tax=Sphingobium chungbukense TaxID=56193 RepID=A0A0M3AHV0_9SPHN|nr:hypothetical protein [Sphingobium chungbukense]KKW89415.1 hypothetical protein YP76_25395 [Sphingobium chungbukense]
MLIYRQNYSALAHARAPIEPDPDLEWIDSRIHGMPPATEADEVRSPGVARSKGRLPAERPALRPKNYAPPILMEIERILKRTGMSATSFGKAAVGDGRLVGDLRKGRDPSSRVTARIRAFIQSVENDPVGSAPMKSAAADDLLPHIHRAMGAHGLSERQFGKSMSNDPNLMSRIRSGENIRPATRQKIVAFLAKLEGRD